MSRVSAGSRNKQRINLKKMTPNIAKELADRKDRQLFYTKKNYMIYKFQSHRLLNPIEVSRGAQSRSVMGASN